MESVLKLVAPLLLEAWNVMILPEIQKLEGEIKSEDLKLVCDKVLEAIDGIIKAELPKL